ncbi:Tetratricopeptide repeat protein [Sulfidibacter corallicola]|uniref:Tetratricopeptide repeat protein n=1 Tax=Sulfidibacter corallicola TaxID=2818388 RepID=A0A8A4THD2_SULCO|nr:tetratricopeptide repeat protein [Sulfidibacter corallicola]QTD48614.1 tetratricopeptide repeat protein [Sulfidibacter corallicola]
MKSHIVLGVLLVILSAMTTLLYIDNRNLREEIQQPISAGVFESELPSPPRMEPPTNSEQIFLKIIQDANTIGFEAAEEKFRKLLRETGSHFYLLGIAWAEHSQGKSDSPIQKCEYILDSYPENQFLRATTLNLLGRVHLKQGDLEKSKEMLHSAADVYVILGYRPMAHRCYLLLCSAYLHDRQPRDAERFLDLAIDALAGDAIPNEGDFFHFKARVSYAQGNIKAAIAFCQKEIQHFREAGEAKAENLAVSLLTLAYYKIHLGQIGEAERLNLEAQKIASTLGLDGKHIIQEINWIYIKKCKGTDFSTHEDRVREHIEKTGLIYVLSNLEEALNWDCVEPKY